MTVGGYAMHGGRDSRALRVETEISKSLKDSVDDRVL